MGFVIQIIITLWFKIFRKFDSGKPNYAGKYLSDEISETTTLASTSVKTPVGTPTALRRAHGRSDDDDNTNNVQSSWPIPSAHSVQWSKPSYCSTSGHRKHTKTLNYLIYCIGRTCLLLRDKHTTRTRTPHWHGNEPVVVIVKVIEVLVDNQHCRAVLLPYNYL